jgi:hypothetical protein
MARAGSATAQKLRTASVMILNAGFGLAILQ